MLKMSSLDVPAPGAACFGYFNCAQALQVTTQSSKYPPGENFACGILQSLNLIQYSVVKFVSDRIANGRYVCEIHYPPRLFAYLSADKYSGAKRMAVHTGALMILRQIRESVRRLESKLFVDFHRHQGIPRYLWVCTLRRHSGWALQYATARELFSASAGPSMGWSRKCSKSQSSNISGSDPACG